MRVKYVGMQLMPKCQQTINKVAYLSRKIIKFVMTTTPLPEIFQKEHYCETDNFVKKEIWGRMHKNS